MNDSNATIETLKEQVHSFMKERDWEQFHTPKNLSMALGKETGKLFEKFMWVDSQQSIKKFEQNREDIEHTL